MKTVSEQSADVYRLLEEKKEPLTANQIADELKILPNAVYRVANKLIDIGMLQKEGSYPVYFKAVGTNSAMNWYLLAVAESFREEFTQKSKKLIKKNSSNFPSISFIKDRESLLIKTNQDARQAKKSIDFVVSGLEVPDATVLAFRKPAVKGVKIRAIVQRKKEASKEKLEKWQDIGAYVKYLPDIGIRMFIFDSSIVYLTSYSSTSKEKAFGIRFAYAPIALQMETLFEENWKKAKKI